MRNKGLTVFAVFAMLLCFLFVSCQAEPNPPKFDEEPEVNGKPEEADGLIEVTLALEDVKGGLIITVPDGVDQYQYRAIPLFEVDPTEGAGGAIFGEQRFWRNFVPDNDGRFANMGWYRQGYWRFEIRTLNRNGFVLMTGTTADTGDVYLQKGKDNVVKVTLKTDDGDGREGENENTGKIKFAFETNWLDDSFDKQYVRLEVDKLTTSGEVETNWGRKMTTFVLKNGTPLTGPDDTSSAGAYAGEGWLDSYDTTGNTYDGPKGPEKATYGYADGWTTVLQNQEDNGLLGMNVEKPGHSARVPDGRIRFYAETPDLIEEPGTVFDEDGQERPITLYKGGITPGSYICRAKVCTVDENGSEIVLGGQTMAVKVVGGEVTTVVGSLLLEKYIDTGLSISIPDNVDGSLASDGAFEIKFDDLTGQYINLTYTPKNDIDQSQLAYSWSVNGILVPDADTKTFKLPLVKDHYGDYKVTCVVSGKSGEFLGEIASATQVVRVIEATGPNIG